MWFTAHRYELFRIRAKCLIKNIDEITDGFALLLKTWVKEESREPLDSPKTWALE